MTDTVPEVFTRGWAARFRDEINDNPDYKQHGSTWRSPVTLEMSFRGSASLRRVTLDLQDGACRDATCGPDDGNGLAIRTDVAGWQKILAGKMDPIWGIMSGQLKLVRGSLTELIPYALAAKALVDSAARIPATFPPAEGP